MKEIMRYISSGCISFTLSSVFYLFFSSIDIFPPYDEQLAFTMLFISISILFFIYIIHLLPIQSSLLSRLLEVFIVQFVLIVAISFFNMVPLKSIYTIYVLGMGLAVYILLITILFIGDKATADKINLAIRSRNKERKEVNEQNY
ncbi:hypothetical protein ACXYMX_13235 [Sporosarcina sp. CAU 1771]